MSLLGWIFFGLITGFIASHIVNERGQGCFVDIVLGLLGAVVGGFIFRSLTSFDVFRFNLTSMFVAVIGAIVVLFVFHAIRGRGRVH